jgi:hypothetical protein
MRKKYEYFPALRFFGVSGAGFERRVYNARRCG